MVVNFLLRVISVFAKFLLIIYISKVLSLEILGVYNIISVTVAWAVFVLGFEFYSFSLRQIAGETEEKVALFIFNQSVFHFVGFCVLILSSPLFVYFGFIPVNYILYFLGITLFDQLSQECYRICVALNRSQFANVIYLIKSGLWVYPLLLWPAFQKTIYVELILQFWLGANVLALMMGLYKFRQLNILSWKGFPLKLDWLYRGIKTSFPFLIISIAQLVIDFSDRYLIDYYLGKSDVGIYSFFYGIVNVPINLITNVLVAQYYSKILNNYKFETVQSERTKVNMAFLKQNLLFGLIMSAGCLICIHPLLNFVGKQELIGHLPLFYLMLAQVLLFSIQIVVQTVLYAKHQDRLLLYSAIGGSVTNVGLNIFLIPWFGVYGATTSTLLAMSFILVSRIILFKRNGKKSV